MLLKIDEVAAMMKTTTRSIRRQWYDGTLPAPIRFGKRGIRWRATELATFIESKTPVTPSGN